MVGYWLSVQFAALKLGKTFEDGKRSLNLSGMAGIRLREHRAPLVLTGLNYMQFRKHLRPLMLTDIQFSNQFVIIIQLFCDSS